VLFFLNNESEPEKKPARPAPVPKGSPVKHKTAGQKVLRGKAKSGQDEAQQSASAKLAEHQRELHEVRQRDGLAKYSKEGGGGAGKEGKTWKRFQSYKGEAGLPPEIEDLRVRDFSLIPPCDYSLVSDLHRPKESDGCSTYQWFRSSFSH
jgi:nucleosome binding factor SPN SPT16 subunit